MSSQVRDLEPTPLWNHFADLNAVPRPSKKEEKVIAFMMEFGRGLGLETEKDETGNVIIRKPATAGLEDRPVIALQSHLDMVHQKNAETQFDFDSEGIRMRVEGDWVRAEGTTLGADNGIGVAAIMAILASKDTPHPALEALFTIDEETGMTGAKGFQGELLKARFLLNLDTEEDTELCIGCAGGIDIEGRAEYSQEAFPQGYRAWNIALRGLTGGHSGMDIHLGRANANKLMNRVIYAAAEQTGARLCDLDGGGLRNAIPRESTAVICLPQDGEERLRQLVDELSETMATEYRTTDPELRLELSPSQADSMMAREAQERLLRAIYTLPNGIYRMSPEVPGLVQTSNNLARIAAQEGKLTILCLSRGSVDSEKRDLARAVASAMELAGAQTTLTGDYPGWAPNPESDIVRLMNELYHSLFNEEADVNACHAGLECGILGTHYPSMEMISFGPNIRGAHSPDERVQVSSVQKFWKLLTATLERV